MRIVDKTSPVKSEYNYKMEVWVKYNDADGAKISKWNEMLKSLLDISEVAFVAHEKKP